jgi:hypothetical protein
MTNSKTATAIVRALGLVAVLGGSTQAQEREVPGFAEMVPQVAATLERIEHSVSGLKQMQKEATEEKDVVEVVCLRDKSAQVAKASDAADERAEEFSEAVTENNLEKGIHQFSMLVVIGDAVEALMSEAGQCIGASDTPFADESETTLEIDSNLAETVDEVEPVVPFITGEDPTVQSPDG